MTNATTTTTTPTTEPTTADIYDAVMMVRKLRRRIVEDNDWSDRYDWWFGDTVAGALARESVCEHYAAIYGDEDEVYTPQHIANQKLRPYESVKILEQVDDGLTWGLAHWRPQNLEGVIR